MNVENLQSILSAEGTSVNELTITLFWNADEDLDVTFQCVDGVTIDWSNREPDNTCGARQDVDQIQDQYNQERGDGSFGQIENISVDLPEIDTTYSGSII